jgi:hypothetical protein
MGMTADRYKYWLQRHNWHGTTLHDERERDSLEHLACQNPDLQPLLDHARGCVRQGLPITFDGDITPPVENHKHTTNNTMTELLKAIRAELIDPIVAAINSLATALGNVPVPTAPAQTPEPAPKKKPKASAPVGEPAVEPATTEVDETSAEPPAASPAAPETPAAPAATAAPASPADHGITFEDIKAHVESIRSMPDAQEKRERIKKFLKDKCGSAPSTAECDPQYYPALLKGLQKLGATDTRKKESDDI